MINLVEFSGGLRTDIDASRIADNQTPECENVVFEGGTVKVRPGRVTHGDIPSASGGVRAIAEYHNPVMGTAPGSVGTKIVAVGANNYVYATNSTDQLFTSSLTIGDTSPLLVDADNLPRMAQFKESMYVVDSVNAVKKFFGLYNSAWTTDDYADDVFGALGPRGMAIADGYLYVADPSNDRIVKFSVHGTTSVPTEEGWYGKSTGAGVGYHLPAVTDYASGTTNGAFDSPRDVACDGTYIYVSDTGNNAVQKLQIDGTFTWKKTQFTTNNVTGSNDTYFIGSPYGIDVDGDGNTWVCITYNPALAPLSVTGVLVLSSSGVCQTFLWGHQGLMGDEPMEVAIGDDGYAYVSYYKKAEAMDAQTGLPQLLVFYIDFVAIEAAYTANEQYEATHSYNESVTGVLPDTDNDLMYLAGNVASNSLRKTELDTTLLASYDVSAFDVVVTAAGGIISSDVFSNKLVLQVITQEEDITDYEVLLDEPVPSTAPLIDTIVVDPDYTYADTGVYSFKYTYAKWRNAGTGGYDEGAPSPVNSINISEASTFEVTMYADASAQLSATSGQEDQLRLYIQTPAYPDWRLIATVVAGGSYVVSPVPVVTEADSLLDEYVSRPPAGCTLLMEWQGRMVYAGPNPDNPTPAKDVLIISKWDDPEHISPLNYVTDPSLYGTWVRIGTDGGDITGLGKIGSYLVVMKRRGVWLVGGEPGTVNFSVQQISESNGCISNETIAQVGGNTLCWLDHNRVWGFDGQSFVDIGKPVQAELEAYTETQQKSAFAVYDPVKKFYMLTIPGNTSYNESAIDSSDTTEDTWETGEDGDSAWTYLTVPSTMYFAFIANTPVTLSDGETDSLKLFVAAESFTLPSDAVITGVVVSYQRQAGGTTVRTTDHSVKLIKGGAIVGDNKADTDEWEYGSYETVTYGGEEDLWGTTLSVADVQVADFGVAIQAHTFNEAEVAAAQIFDVEITVYYRPAPSSNSLVLYQRDRGGMGWTKFTQQPGGCATWMHQGTYPAVYAAESTVPTLYRLNSGTDDDGDPIAWKWYTKIFTKPDSVYKSVYKAIVGMKATVAASVTSLLLTLRKQGVAATSTKSFSLTKNDLEETVKWNPPLVGDMIGFQFGVSGEATNECEVLDIDLDVRKKGSVR